MQSHQRLTNAHLNEVFGSDMKGDNTMRLGDSYIAPVGSFASHHTPDKAWPMVNDVTKAFFTLYNSFNFSYFNPITPEHAQFFEQGLQLVDSFIKTFTFERIEQEKFKKPLKMSPILMKFMSLLESENYIMHHLNDKRGHLLDKQSLNDYVKFHDECQSLLKTDLEAFFKEEKAHLAHVAKITKRMKLVANSVLALAAAAAVVGIVAISIMAPYLTIILISASIVAALALLAGCLLHKMSHDKSSQCKKNIQSLNLKETTFKNCQTFFAKGPLYQNGKTVSAPVNPTPLLELKK